MIDVMVPQVSTYAAQIDFVILLVAVIVGFWFFLTLGVFFFPSMPAPLFALLYVVFSIIAAKSRNTNINHDAHIWGGLFGFALTIPLFPGILTSFWLAVQHMLHLI